MDVTIDNQQVTTEKIAWLAGIWDGEGTFSIVKQYKRRYGNEIKNFGLNPKLTMENTSEIIINECCKILGGLGITYYIQERTPRSVKHKRTYILSICRNDMIIKSCKVLLPFLIAKREQASLLLKYSQSRIENLTHYRPKNHVGYSDEEYSICEKLQLLNKLGPVDTSTTLRKTLDVQLINQKRWVKKRDEKIKSDLNGNIQKQAEMTCSRKNISE